jgi:hypothetical protein
MHQQAVIGLIGGMSWEALLNTTELSIARFGGDWAEFTRLAP